jgi:integrase
MAILAECPMCHRKQATKNKVCKCGEDLDRAKRSMRVRYWVNYYLPGKKQKREYVGYSIEEARNAESKRKVQKREDRFFEITLDVNMTFNELSKWYLNLNSVKRLSSYARYKSCISNFNGILGGHKVSAIKPIDLEDYQDTREAQGAAPATIDVELVIVGGMVRRAWDNDLVGDRPIKAFRKVKNKLKVGANARNRTLTMQEYKALLENASEHVKHLLMAGFHTGMRTGELVNLRWSHIDHKSLMIRLPQK